jgi:ech hydrogenase subunit E
LGYAHRGIEKATESRNYAQTLYLMERVCGICSHIHAWAFCQGVEKLAKVEVPERALAMRMLVAELERIHSHILWLGVAAHEAGFDTLFMYSWRDRETVMNLLESITGNRVNYSANILGGVKCDLTPELAADVKKGIDYLEERTKHYLDVVQNDSMFLQRTKNVGTMTPEVARRLGVVGPTARASGVGRDIRIEAPYALYEQFNVQIVMGKDGDLAARFAVRLQELFESFRIIRELADNLPEGPLVVKRMPRRIKPGETVSRIEAPRGELMYFIRSNGTDKPDRVKVRTPTICNMSSVLSLAVGHHLADVPMIMVGIDPCFSCNDRSVKIHNGESSSWSWAQLRQYGIDYYKGLGG